MASDNNHVYRVYARRGRGRPGEFSTQRCLRRHIFRAPVTESRISMKAAQTKYNVCRYVSQPAATTIRDKLDSRYGLLPVTNTELTPISIENCSMPPDEMPNREEDIYAPPGQHATPAMEAARILPPFYG